MAKFISMQETPVELENMVRNTRENLFLISPYFEVSEQLLKILKSNPDDKLKITVIYKTGLLSQNTKKQFFDLKNVYLRHVLNLNSKCCFNEESMIIGSLNLLDKSAQFSREMSILVKSDEDGQIFKNALNEAKIIISSSLEDEGQPVQKTSAGGQGKIQTSGYCIRCQRVIPYNIDLPFCPACYKVWAEFENPDYEESFCHACGKQAVTALSRPLCSKCRNS